ncbi:MAG TPA: tetratricopeptide repeat protein [Candidatus Coatesbacteria bacterium]|nr:tetratricopeptide repeat protein [Candidatus Coatesbacteria bacterium]
MTKPRLNEPRPEAAPPDPKRRQTIIAAIIAAAAVLAVILYFVISAGPPESRTALRLAQGIQSYGLAFEGRLEYPEEGSQPVWVEPTPEQTQQRLSEALAIFNEVALAPGSDFDRDAAVLYVGMCALHLGNLDQAQQKLSQAATSEFEPLRQQARYALGAVLLERGQLPEALEHYRGLAAEPGNYLALTARLETARILAWLGRPEESKAVLEAVVAAGPEEEPRVQSAKWMLEQGVYLTGLVDLFPFQETSGPDSSLPAEGADLSP